MKYQTLLGAEETKNWVEIEVSIGNNSVLIKEEWSRLSAFLKNFDQVEIDKIKSITGSDIDVNNPLPTNNKRNVRLLLIKRFIDRNNPLIIAEALSLGLKGSQLEKYLFLLILDDLYSKNKFPTNYFAYCTFKKRGSPVTWLKINSDLTPDKVAALVQSKAKSLCNSLTYKLRRSRDIRFIEKINGLDIYLISKPSGADVVRAEGHNQEIQGASFSILVFDSANFRLGYISGTKKEIGDVHHFIRKKLLPDQIYAPRNDKSYEGKKLLEDLLVIDTEKSSLQLSGLALKNTNLPNNPSIRIESSDDSPVDAAVGHIKDLWNGRDISDMKTIDYKIGTQVISIYPFGDDWGRYSLNVDSKGKSSSLESELLKELKSLLGVDIKETKFITQDLSLDFIIDKLLKDKKASTEPPIPEVAEKTLVELIKQGLLKKPKEIAKRRCENWGCRVISWTDWQCPRCGRSMIVIGEYVTVEINEAKCLEQLTTILEPQLPDYEIKRQTIQRKKYKRSVIRVHNRKKDVALYVVTVVDTKDLNFCEALASEGYGLVVLIDPEMFSKRTALEGLGATCLEMAKVVSELKKHNDSTQSLLKDIFSDTFSKQEDEMLIRINRRLVDSERSLRNKTNYDPEIFEIDLKNIIQALVPNVVRLGTKFKGKQVPDGYCSFMPLNGGNDRVFGWDAKYSIAGRYSLTKKDLNKQLGYIKWLSTTPEPKSLGSLRIYALISNFNSINGFATVLSAIRRSSQKPRLCRVVLIEDMLIVELASWMLSNWQKVLTDGPKISQTFFDWIVSSDRSQRNRWFYSIQGDWNDLKAKLDAI